jgi:hypothetical protein
MLRWQPVVSERAAWWGQMRPSRRPPDGHRRGQPVSVVNEACPRHRIMFHARGSCPHGDERQRCADDFSNSFRCNGVMPPLGVRIKAAYAAWLAGPPSLPAAREPRRSRIRYMPTPMPSRRLRPARHQQPKIYKKGEIVQIEVRPHWIEIVSPAVSAVTALAAIGALIFTAKQLSLAERGQITDRFGRAVEQVGQSGSEKLDVRLGGIYSLERIMRDSPKEDQPAVTAVLANFIRIHSTAPELGKPVPELTDAPSVSPDVQAAFTALGQRNPVFDRAEDALNLKRAGLAGVELIDANLAGADLSGADLRYAYLPGADLADANLNDTLLVGINLERANLREIELTENNLGGAQMSGSFLSGAQLASVNFRGSHLEGADLEGADLSFADLRDVWLIGANLRGAELRHVDLRGADLRNSVHVTSWQLRCARVDDSTLLPSGVIRPKEGAFEFNNVFCE